MEKKYPIDDWSNYIPQMSNIQDRTGISIEWQKLWSEIENWYGDIKKHETGEQFLKRMQATYFVQPGARWVKASERLPEKDGYYCFKANGGYMGAYLRTGSNGNRWWCDSAGGTIRNWKNCEWLDESGK